MRLDTMTPNRFVLDPKNMADLRSSIKENPQAGLKAAAQQFESMMLQMVLKSMRDATPQSGMMDSDQTRFFTSILDQQLAQNLSSQGKLGFARLIEQQLGRNLTAGMTAAPMELDGMPSDVFQKSLLLQRQAANSAGARVAGAGASRWRSTPDAVSGSQLSVGTDSGAGEFVSRIWPYALGAANALGVPTQFVVAHSALESGWGKGEIRLANGAPSFNLFGVKAGRGWQGPSVEVQTTEYVDGVAQTVKERFRVYGSYAESFRDYANLLRNNGRFSSVIGQQDGARFAGALQRSGYATDPAYAEKLTRIINGTTLRQALIG